MGRSALGGWNRLACWLADERGQMLAWTLIVTLAGGLIIGGFLVYATTSLITTTGSSEQVRAYYTADAGAERCLVSLTVGDDNCNFTLVMNGYTATVSIAGPLTNLVPSAPRYIDTGLEGVTLTAGNAWALELNSRPITIQVNWPFSPSPSPWELRLYQGQGIDGPLVVTNTGMWSPAQLQAPASLMTDGVHTVLFYNIAPTTTTVAANFSASGGISNTWVWANASQDYIITSTVLSTVLEVVARQTPGTTLITNPITLTVVSWQFR